MTIAAITEGLAFILRAIKTAMRRRAAVDLKAGEKLVEATEASVAEIDKLVVGVAP